jgi:hypothetical protein
MTAVDPVSLSVRDLLWEAACVATRAPSIANSQPQLWHIRGDVLELRCDRPGIPPILWPWSTRPLGAPSTLIGYAAPCRRVNRWAWSPRQR